MRRKAFAPGRVNLIGEHVDYTGGLVLPMAIDRGTTVEVEVVGDDVVLTTDLDPEPEGWRRYVEGVARLVEPASGVLGTVTSDLPVGAGLSSSASLELAVALALGFDGTAKELALLGQRAEHEATGVPCGIMDQLVSASGVEDHALLIDCHNLDTTPVRIPDELEVVVVHSGVSHRLVDGAYAERRAQCEAAEAVVGPLRLASLDSLPSLSGVELMRARHVITENQRVRDFVDALGRSDFAEAGRVMSEGHASLRDNFETSVPEVDALVDRLQDTPGVYGARMTGGGFGGCVVALAEPGTPIEGWRFRPAAGARLL